MISTADKARFTGATHISFDPRRGLEIGKQIVLVAQKQADVDEPGPGDVYDFGTLATILQLLKLPDGTVKVLVEGGQRVALKNIREGEYFTADIEVLEDTTTPVRPVPGRLPRTIASSRLPTNGFRKPVTSSRPRRRPRRPDLTRR